MFSIEVILMYLPKYSEFSLLIVIMFCKVTVNTMLANIQPLLLKEIHSFLRESGYISSTGQCITLTYKYLCVKISI